MDNIKKNKVHCTTKSNVDFSVIKNSMFDFDQLEFIQFINEQSYKLIFHRIHNTDFYLS